MKLLEERILRDGIVRKGDILKVDGFLNHRIDPDLTSKLGEEFARLYGGQGVTKVLTIEASGIALACFTAFRLQVPMLFAKKSKSANISDDIYKSQVMSYTHNKTVYDIFVSKEYLEEGDRVLIVDDFLAHGEALRGLISLVEQAGATVVGCGVAIEKVYQGGGNDVRKKGYRVESLAKVAAMTDDGKITFAD